MREEHRKLLRPLIAPARKHLEDLDSALVPHRLLPVVRSSARHLPRPLEKVLIEGIEADAELREAVAERWAATGRRDAGIEAFLEDPDAFADVAEGILRQEEAEQSEHRIAELEAEVERTRAERDEAKRRLAEARSATEAETAARREADKRARAGLEARAEAAERAREEAEGALAEARLAADELAADVRDLQEEVTRLRERGRRRSGPIPVAKRGAVDVPTEPVSLARWLDAAERIVRPFRKGAESDAGEPEGGLWLAVPDGIAPDSGAALLAVVEQGPSLFVVDGYNVAGALGITPIHSAVARDAVLARAAALRRLSSSRVVVVFDAKDVEGRKGFATDSGVDVRFSKDRSADDEIVEIVRSSPLGTVVVSNDREVRDHSAAHGVVVLWSDALIDALNL